MQATGDSTQAAKFYGYISRLGSGRHLGILAIVCAFVFAAWMPAAAQNCSFNSIFPTPVLTGNSLGNPGPCPSVLDYFFQDAGGSAITAAVADFNRDGIPDVLVAQGGSSYNFAVQLGNGDGTFQAPIYNYALPQNGPDLRGANWAIAGDFNGDGYPDVAVGTANGYVAVYLGNGTASFTLSQYVAVTSCCSGPGAAVVGDFNGDGKLDLAVVDGTTQPGRVIVLLGKGDGTFQANPAVITVGDTSSHPDSIVVGDFNHDGKLDFATVNYSGNYSSTISLVMGNGDGTFQAPVNYYINVYPACTYSQNCATNGGESIAAADFNHDGYLDLAVLNQNGVIAVFLNNSDGTFQTPAYYSAGFNYNNNQHPLELATGDFNKDGNIDLVFIANQQSAAGVLFGNGDGTFGKSVYYVTDAGNYGENGVAVGDFNGDGNLDVVVASTDTNDLTVLLGNGDGSFKGARSYVPWPISAGFSRNVPNPTSVAFGDFNGDGKPDMAVVDQNNSDITIFLGNGDGSFTESANYHTGPYPGTVVAAADLNGDGKLDLVVGLHAGTHDYGFSVLLGNGDGTFQPPVTYSNGSHGGISTLILADVNGDGNLDVVSGSENGGDVYVTSANASLFVNLGNGDGTFQTGVATPGLCPGGGGAGAYLEAVADLNGDGRPDIAAVCDGSLHQSYISVLLGNGDGSFGAPAQVPSGETPVGIAAGDFNQDGKMDLAVVDNWPTPGVSILLGMGDGTFQAPVFYSVFSSAFWQAYKLTYGTPGDTSPGPIVAADFNRQGHLDLLVGDSTATMSNCCPNYGSAVYNNGVQLFVGNGDGTFQPALSFMAGRQATFLAVADLNGDGAPDVAAVDSQDASVVILLNQKGGAVLQTVAVAPNPASVAAGLTQQFTATGHYSDGTTKDLTASATWSSSNPAVATISNAAGTQGLATGVAAGGPVTISAAQGGITGTAPLTITAPLLQSISVSPRTASVPAGFTQQFDATGTYSDGSTQTITGSVNWSSANTSVATISNSGLATGVAAGGPVTITATQGSISGTANLSVTAPLLQSISLSPPLASIAKGLTQQFTATGHFSDNSTQTLTGLTWSSSNTSIASVSNTGLATGVAVGGPVTITAAQGSITGTAQLTVTAAILVSIAVTPANAQIPVGASQQYAATAMYSDGTTSNVTKTATWVSSNTAVASMGKGALVKAVGLGTTTISASFGGKTATTTLTTFNLSVSPALATIAAGATQQFTAVATFADSSTAPITSGVGWKSSNNKVATIDSTGLASGVKAGKTGITATVMKVSSAPATLTVQ